MKSISDWASAFPVNDRPWLLLGKGPSFSRFEPGMSESFHLMGLNHVSRGTPVTLAHFIDLDAFVACVPEILGTARWVVIPWHPHEGFAPSRKTLADCVREVPALETLESDGRVLTYNLSTAKGLDTLQGAPLIEAKFFSAEAGLNVLAAAGVRTVRSLGVDGGTDYASQFGDLASRTRLANGHKTFDLQFQGIARTIRRTGIQYAPLYVDSPARVFVGADPTQELPFRVLEFSTKKFATLSVEFGRIDNEGLKVPSDPSNRSRTGFSFSRFRIPRLCGYTGRAIYLDADMQVFGDLMELWTRPFDGASMLYAEHDSADGRIPQYSVLLLDCEALDWDPDAIIDGLDSGRFTYESLMYDFALVPADKRRPGLPNEWNSLERYVPGETRLLHYTDMPTQPWVNRRNRYADVWLGDLREALVEGFISEEFLFDQIERGHVSPELPDWLGIDAPVRIRNRIAGWEPPYRRFAGTATAARFAEAVPEPAVAGSPLAPPSSGQPALRRRMVALGRIFDRLRGSKDFR